MNSSEIKKIIWFVNFVVFCGLALVGYFAWNLAQKPVPAVVAFRYVEPQVHDIGVKKRDLVLLSEVTDVFGEKKVALPPKPPVDPNINKPKPPPPPPPKPEIEPIDRILELHHILGRLAFVYVKKDRLLKTVVVGEEITTLSDESLGVLKEIREDYVLILLNEKIETLYIDPESKKKVLSSNTGETIEPGAEGSGLVNQENGRPGGGAKSGVSTGSAVVKKSGNASFTPIENVPQSTHAPVADKVNTAASPVPAENASNVVPEIKVESVQAETFHGQAYEFAEIIDKDGVTRKQIPVAMAKQLQNRENMQKFLNSNNYGLVYRKDGIFIQKINDGDIAKFFGTIGIQVGDLIIRANGQHLGSKSEDDLLELVQQITDSSTHLDLEYKHKGQDRRVRVAVGEIQGKFNK